MNRRGVFTIVLLAAFLLVPSLALATGEAEPGVSSVDPALNSMPGGCTWCHGADVYGNRQGPHTGFSAVSNKCETCHNVHVAAGSNLLFKTTSTATCLACHDGTGGYGVYGTIKARGLTPGAEHRAIPPTTSVVPGGDPSGGFRTETAYVGEGGFLSCVDCHSPHNSSVVAEFETERERLGGFGAPYKTLSTNLLKRRPNGSDTTSTVYGSDWCAGCHRGRHSGGGAVNHPVDSAYSYGNVPIGSWLGPVELGVAASGDVYVIDPGNHRVQRFNGAGAYLGQWSQGYGGLTFEDPRGLVIAGGEVLVSDPLKGYVSRFDASGAYLGYFSGPSNRWRESAFGAGLQITPAGLGTNPSGTALVLADTEGSNVSVRTPPAGALVRRLPQNLWSPFPGTATNQFYAPTDAAVDSAGNVYVADSMNRRVTKYGANGVLVGVFASGTFERPISVAVDASDRVYVVDAGKHTVSRYLSNGTLQSTFGTLGTGNGQFSAPRGIALDAGGNIYVVDSGNSRVLVLASDGTYLRSWGTQGTGNGQFDFNPVKMGPLAYASSRTYGEGTVYGGLGYVMQEPRAAVQVGHAPICQQCHEDTRFAGALYDGVALGGPLLSFTDGELNRGFFSDVEPLIGPVTSGSRDVLTPRFQNFPHETVNDSMVVETGDDLCLNCHGKALP